MKINDLFERFLSYPLKSSQEVLYSLSMSKKLVRYG